MVLELREEKLTFMIVFSHFLLYSRLKSVSVSGDASSVGWSLRSVRFGYDLSYRVRAPEAASATTQRTENPIRRLFVFLDPRA